MEMEVDGVGYGGKGATAVGAGAGVGKAAAGRERDGEARAGGRLLRFLGEDSGLSQYLKEIGKTKNLTLEQEADLAMRVRLGDRRALNKLIRHNLKFVVSVCRNYQNQGLPMTDLINEGNLGLIRAAKRFDETKQFKFISYAVWWIRQAILQALAEQSRIINVPLNKVGAIHRIGRAAARLEQRLGRTPSPLEVAESLGMEEGELRDSLQLTQNPLSLDAPVQSDDDSRLGDLLKDEALESPDQRSLERGRERRVREVLDTLEEREGEVLRLYFGIGMATCHTLEEIGQRFNLTRERVRQIKERALKRLKHPSRSRLLTAYQG